MNYYRQRLTPGPLESVPLDHAELAPIFGADPVQLHAVILLATVIAIVGAPEWTAVYRHTLSQP